MSRRRQVHWLRTRDAAAEWRSKPRTDIRPILTMLELDDRLSELDGLVTGFSQEQADRWYAIIDRARSCVALLTDEELEILSRIPREEFYRTQPPPRPKR